MSVRLAKATIQDVARGMYKLTKKDPDARRILQSEFGTTKTRALAKSIKKEMGDVFTNGRINQKGIEGVQEINPGINVRKTTLTQYLKMMMEKEKKSNPNAILDLQG